MKNKTYRVENLQSNHHKRQSLKQKSLFLLGSQETVSITFSFRFCNFLLYGLVVGVCSNFWLRCICMVHSFSGISKRLKPPPPFHCCPGCLTLKSNQTQQAHGKGIKMRKTTIEIWSRK